MKLIGLGSNQALSCIEGPPGQDGDFQASPMDDTGCHHCVQGSEPASGSKIQPEHKQSTQVPGN